MKSSVLLFPIIVAILMVSQTLLASGRGTGGREVRPNVIEDVCNTRVALADRLEDKPVDLEKGERAATYLRRLYDRIIALQQPIALHRERLRLLEEQSATNSGRLSITDRSAQLASLREEQRLSDELRRLELEKAQCRATIDIASIAFVNAAPGAREYRLRRQLRLHFLEPHQLDPLIAQIRAHEGEEQGRDRADVEAIAAEIMYGKESVQRMSPDVTAD